MRLIIIRHADPDYPNNTITPAGHLEAKALAERMKRIRPHVIYSSPMGRALHTMQYTADALDMPHEVLEWTAELSDCAVELPEWGRLKVWDVPGEIIRERYPCLSRDNWYEHEVFCNPLFRQRYDHVARESDALLAQHGYQRDGGRYRIVESNQKNIAIFCHLGFATFWLAHLLELPLPLVWSAFWLPPSSVTTVLFDERSKQWAVPRCVGVGDVSHLYAAGLPIQRAGLLANSE